MITTDPAELIDKMAVFYNKRTDYYDNADKIRAANIEHLSIPESTRLLLEQVRENDIVVDFGCGNGQLIHYLKMMKLNVRYYGIDISNNALEACRKEFPEYTFIQNDLTSVPLESGFADVVISTYALEHFTRPQEILKEMIRLVQTEGVILIVCPDCENIVEPPRSLKLGSRILAEKFGRKSLPNLIYYFINRLRYSLLRLYYELMERLAAKPVFLFVKNPRCLEEENFEWDWDLTHLVRYRTMKLFFENNKCSVQRLADDVFCVAIQKVNEDR